MEEQELQQACIFCGIANGKVPSKKVHEDDMCMAVLDINPAASGHVLVIPKKHYQITPQIPDNELAKIISVAKTISASMLKALKSEGSTVFAANGAAAGQKAPHVMLHVIPRFSNDGLDVLKIPEQDVPGDKLNESGQILLNMIQKKLGEQK